MRSAISRASLGKTSGGIGGQKRQWWRWDLRVLREQVAVLKHERVPFRPVHTTWNRALSSIVVIRLPSGSKPHNQHEGNSPTPLASSPSLASPRLVQYCRVLMAEPDLGGITKEPPPSVAPSEALPSERELELEVLLKERDEHLTRLSVSTRGLSD